MKNAFLKIIMVVIALFAGTFTSQAKSYTLVWSHYTGWEPWAYAESSGILAANAKKYGVDIRLELINDYGESINRYVADKNVIGVTITEMDALTGPCVGGIDTTAIIIGDYSNGNDGIVAKNIKTMSGVKGTTIMLVENSVSHYLLYRGLQMSNMAITDVKTKNVSDADMASVFTASPGNAVCVTWNPPLMTVRQVKNTTELLNSSRIPGEILDMLVVKTDTPETVKKALTATWYDVMKIMYGSGTKTDAALDFMAKSAGGTRAEFDSQLKTTFMFNEPTKGVEFAKDAKLKQTLDYVRTFCFERGLYNGASTKDSVGIEFPDGSVLGSKRNVRLRFTTKYMEAAANGTL